MNYVFEHSLHEGKVTTENAFGAVTQEDEQANHNLEEADCPEWSPCLPVSFDTIPKPITTAFSPALPDLSITGKTYISNSMRPGICSISSTSSVTKLLKPSLRSPSVKTLFIEGLPTHEAISLSDSFFTPRSSFYFDTPCGSSQFGTPSYGSFGTPSNSSVQSFSAVAFSESRKTPKTPKGSSGPVDSSCFLSAVQTLEEGTTNDGGTERDSEEDDEESSNEIVVQWRAKLAKGSLTLGDLKKWGKKRGSQRDEEIESLMEVRRCCDDDDDDEDENDSEEEGENIEVWNATNDSIEMRPRVVKFSKTSPEVHVYEAFPWSEYEDTLPPCDTAGWYLDEMNEFVCPSRDEDSEEELGNLCVAADPMKLYIPCISNRREVTIPSTFSDDCSTSAFGFPFLPNLDMGDISDDNGQEGVQGEEGVQSESLSALADDSFGDVVPCLTEGDRTARNSGKRKVLSHFPFSIAPFHMGSDFDGSESNTQKSDNQFFHCESQNFHTSSNDVFNKSDYENGMVAEKSLDSVMTSDFLESQSRQEGSSHPSISSLGPEKEENISDRKLLPECAVLQIFEAEERFNTRNANCIYGADNDHMGVMERGHEVKNNKKLQMLPLGIRGIGRNATDSSEGCVAQADEISCSGEVVISPPSAREGDGSDSAFGSTPNKDDCSSQLSIDEEVSSNGPTNIGPANSNRNFVKFTNRTDNFTAYKAFGSDLSRGAPSAGDSCEKGGDAEGDYQSGEIDGLIGQKDRVTSDDYVSCCCNEDLCSRSGSEKLEVAYGYQNENYRPTNESSTTCLVEGMSSYCEPMRQRQNMKAKLVLPVHSRSWVTSGSRFGPHLMSLTAFQNDSKTFGSHFAPPFGICHSDAPSPTGEKSFEGMECGSSISTATSSGTPVSCISPSHQLSPLSPYDSTDVQSSDNCATIYSPKIYEQAATGIAFLPMLLDCDTPAPKSLTNYSEAALTGCDLCASMADNFKKIEGDVSSWSNATFNGVNASHDSLTPRSFGFNFSPASIDSANDSSPSSSSNSNKSSAAYPFST